MMLNKCSKCNGKLIETSDGEIVCSQCGVVYGYKYWNDSIFIEDRNISTRVISSDAEDGSFISSASKDTYKRPVSLTYRKLKEYHIHIKYGNRSTHLRVFKELNAVAYQLGLPNYVINEAKRLYMYLCQNVVPSLGRKRPFYHRIAAACLICAAKKYGYNINKILKLYAKRGHKITLSNVWEILSLLNKKGLYTTYPNIKDYTLKFLNIALNNLNLSIDERRESIRLCNIVLRKLDSRCIQGKSPRVLAATIVYYAISQAMRTRMMKLSVKTIAKILDVNDSSIRKRLPTIIAALEK
ncbi:MAG: hypothetical protein DRJ52_01795 [Thermoprotei archaeon]|nr:MAG: hypothetical protein DRJ52_01795 [Thermoprotei archaeon]